MKKNEEGSYLSDEILNCTQCELYKTRKNPVVGEGSLDADFLFIGEAPGANEDKQGRPFVGRAGAILDDLIHSIGLKREDVYIANILKCRPPKNRNPKDSEIKVCSSFLEKQINLINPTVILPMGSFSTKYIFKRFDLPFSKISKLHGKMYTKQTLYDTIHILPLYHPAVATYNPNKISILLEDIKQIESFIRKQSV